MRFEELSYRVDSLPITAPFHPSLTVVGPLAGRARAGWIERVLGVLLGSRPGDGVGLVFRDHAGQRIHLQRDHHGAARLTGVDTEDDFTPAAGDLPLDGRYDWFASLGLDNLSARALVRIVPADFKGDTVDPWEAEDELCEARGLLDQVEAEYETVLTKLRQAEELHRRVDDLDEQVAALEEERARRQHGEALQTVRRLEAKTAILREAVASERAEAEATLAAAQAGDEWRQAVDRLEVARLAFGERPRPDPAIAERPADGDGDGSGGDGALVAELEAVHRAVEEAERELDRAPMPALAMAARRRLGRARREEEAVLHRMGFGSWLAFQIQRVDILFGQVAEAAADAGPEMKHSVTDPDAARAERAREARLRHTLHEAELACRAAQGRLETLLTKAGLPPAGHPDELAAQISALAIRAAEAAVHRKAPPTSGALGEIEVELSAAWSALAALSRPGWDEHPFCGETPLPDPEPLLEERAHLFEEAYRIERELPDLGRLEDRHVTLTRRIAWLEAASRDGYQLKSIEEAEMVLLGRVAQARRVGPGEEPVPLLIDNALAGYDRQDKHDLLHLLARLAETTQVVYLTDDVVTLEWASAQAREGEALVVPPPTVPPAAIASVA